MGKPLDRITGMADAFRAANKLNCAFVMLGHGRWALIDYEDVEAVWRCKWHLTDNRYVRSHLGGSGSRYLENGMGLHRYLVKPSKGMDVDHINGDTQDCRRSNLRLATRAQNLANGKRRSHNKASKFKGVRRHFKKWVARIRCNGKSTHLGTFNTERQAAIAYNEAAVKLFGEFARPNEV